MIQTQIQPISTALASALLNKINNKTKPLGSLGRLEKLALQVGLIQDTLTPELNKPVMMVFAGDHGIVQAGVSPFPQEVTQQMVFNFLSGGAAINIFSQTNAMQVRVIDAGVNHHFGMVPGLIDAKIGMGTQNFLTTPAMTQAQCEQALTVGISLAHKEFESCSNVMGFGEMGIGNTSSASALMAVLCELPPEQCVGRGTGLDDAGLQKKIDVIKAAVAQHKLDAKDACQVLATFGGFEIAMMVGAMLGAAEKKCVLLIDGFIATSALLVASKMQPEVLEYCVFAHCSNESGHRLLLHYLKAEPLLDLGLRLGEGTGAALAYPLVKAAVNFLNEMASFESANVSQAE
ncbi:nicotinate-nucleotide--dimethylbenzimidazole phosphoribosyltransferase [Methyloradius palustris]|uniref:Nicotinate-nucleotide--dimethylbenzimidazole phosphoribosyltransferase n=1 Tax=Methyloradius palustris TaxID=2778876 RepID=A0A8D5FY36_9PROT|nr:nicotinate-nucleotide--dimethylbenzimidazole phosphoribosyltransferase [Methyloradius palustris]BCM23855.1 nicotinate-nucleotide--dimethylbenzimidazole phosphoribosyltransferase [Methyloradius palustris]